MSIQTRLHTLVAICVLPASWFADAQHIQQVLPDAPKAQIMAMQQDAPHPPASSGQTPSTNTNVQPDATGPRLTLAEAEQMALQHNPQVSIAHLLSLAQKQVTREVRAGELPTAVADLTAVDSHENSRITAGALNNPIVYERMAGGLTVSQLITDFGRVHHLVRNAQSNAQAQLDEERASTQDISLTVDQAFFQALTAQQVLRVAQQTVATRQATGDQVSALTKSNLRSTLDLSLADVQVSQAKMLVLDAQDNLQAAMANLNALLGSDSDIQYDLVDETTETPVVPADDVEAMVQLAFKARPDLAALNERYIAARQFASAEHDLLRPTISALAAAGGTPIRPDQISSSWYGAAGANVSIPLFNGFDYIARAKEADLRTQVAAEQVRSAHDDIARDVRTAVLNAQLLFQRIAVARQLRDQANTALDLAQARYKVGLSGIVDLTQAQLAETQAEISLANARYAYQTALAELKFQTGQ